MYFILYNIMLGTYQLISMGVGGGGLLSFPEGREFIFPPDRGRVFFHQAVDGIFFYQTGGDIFFPRIQETIFFSKAITAEQ